MLYLTEDDVAAALDMRIAIEAVEGAFRALAEGTAVNSPRSRVVLPGAVLHSMSAGAEYLGLLGWKQYTTTRSGAIFHVGLYDQESGKMLALIEADYLGRLRTGAATGVAAEWMAAPEASEMGLFGTGKQAETQLEAISVVRPLKQAFVYSRSAERRTAFAEKMSAKLSIEVTPVDRPQEGAEDLPIVVTCTASKTPVFDGACLAEGAFVAAVGSNWLNKAEIDVTTIRRADNIVCDSLDACRIEAGDFVEAIEKGIFDWSRAFNLADVVAGRSVGRSTPESITLFKSVGLAIEDVALAARLLKKSPGEPRAEAAPA